MSSLSANHPATHHVPTRRLIVPRGCFSALFGGTPPPDGRQIWQRRSYSQGCTLRPATVAARLAEYPAPPLRIEFVSRMHAMYDRCARANRGDIEAPLCSTQCKRVLHLPSARWMRNADPVVAHPTRN